MFDRERFFAVYNAGCIVGFLFVLGKVDVGEVSVPDPYSSGNNEIPIQVGVNIPFIHMISLRFLWMAGIILSLL